MAAALRYQWHGWPHCHLGSTPGLSAFFQDRTAVPFEEVDGPSVKGQQVGGDSQPSDHMAVPVRTPQKYASWNSALPLARGPHPLLPSSLCSSLEHMVSSFLHPANTQLYILAPGLGHHCSYCWKASSLQSSLSWCQHKCHPF